MAMASATVSKRCPMPSPDQRMSSHDPSRMIGTSSTVNAANTTARRRPASTMIAGQSR